MFDGLHDISSTCFTFGTDESGTFGNSTECFAKVTSTTDKRYFEIVFVDMVLLICRSEHFRFINVIDSNSLQNLRLHEVTDSDFGHDWDSDCLDDFLDHLWVTLLRSQQHKPA